MERIRNLDRWPKFILTALLAMALIFAAVYGFVTNRDGYLFNDAILVPTVQGDSTVYSGRLDGEDAAFTVTGSTVTFVRGGRTYGPYTLREDPTAVPENHVHAEYMWGFEITQGEDIFFRGSLFPGGDGILYKENGEFATFYAMMTLGDGTVLDMDGNIVDPYAPSAWNILELYRGPELQHKGLWSIYLLCLFASGMTALSILFADELFRHRMSFRVRDAYRVEPSDWELASRTISWTILVFVILWGYLIGLR